MIKSLFTIGYLFLHFAAQAQVASALVTVDDGLPINSVWTITQDKNGIMWFGSVDGMSSYDGYSVKIYKNIPGDSTSISENCRHDIFVDSENNLWIAHNSGISKFYQATETFDNLFTYAEKKNRDIINRVVGEDKLGNIWSWIYGEGLVVFNKKGDLIKKYKAPNIINEKCIMAKFDSYYNVYLSLDQSGYYKFNLQSERFDVFLQNRLGGFCITSKNNLLVGSNTNSVLQVDAAGKIINTFTINESDLSKESALLFISYIVEFNDNIFYVGTTDGLFKLNLTDGMIKRFNFSKNAAENYAIGDCLFKDNSGNLWAGTTADGVCRFLLGSKKFDLLEPSNSNHTIVKAITKNSDFLFIGYFDGGIDMYDNEHQLVKHIDAIKTNMPSNHVNALIPIGGTKLLVGFTLSCDVGVLDYAAGTYKSIIDDKPQIKSDFFSIENLANCFYKAENNVFLINRNEYIYRITVSGNDIKIEQIDTIPSAITTYVFMDNNALLWVGSYNGVYTKQNNKWKKIALPVDLNVKCITQHPNGDIWVSGDKGIFILDDDANVKQSFNINNGLPNEYVYGLLFEPDGTCWMSHNKGISQFKSEALNFRNYTKSDGIQSNEFNTGAFYKDVSGYYYFGGINGVNYFRPETVKDNATLPFNRIQQIMVNDELYVSDSNHAYIKMLALTHDENTISFQFAGIEFTNPAFNKYKYRLKNVDKNWVEAGNQRQVRYANLAPGNYVFEVISCNNDGIWNLSPAYLNIVISPPYWQTAWFRIICSLLLLIIIIVSLNQLYKYNTRKQRRQAEIQQKLQHERERISRDLHDNVGAQLSFITSNIDWIINPVTAVNKAEEQERLTEVSNTAQNIIGNLRETIWALNKQAIEVEDLSDKLKSFFQKQMQFNQETKLVFKEEIINNITFSPSEALHIFRIGQEIANNCQKYAKATIITISISTALNGDFNLAISDNGIGFDQNERTGGGHYGLDNMQARAKEIDGKLIIRSLKDMGTTIILEIAHTKIHQM